MIITINLSQSAAARMALASRETERTAADLASEATEEALLAHFKPRDDDPGAQFMERY